MLHEEEAWRIATMWKTGLSGCVRIVTSAENDMQTVIPSYEWVEFNLSGAKIAQTVPLASLQKRWNATQAASITWAMLACCKGYGGHENAVFWRRVFREYDVSGSKITDATRFFAHNTFPRYRLDVIQRTSRDGIFKMYRRLLQRKVDTADVPVSRLVPFILSYRLARNIEWCVKFPGGGSSFARAYKGIQDVVLLLQTRQWGASFVKGTPLFVLRHIELSSLELKCDKEVEAVAGLLDNLSVPCPRLIVKVDSQVSVHAIARLMRTIANTAKLDGCCRVRDLTLECRLTSDCVVDAIFSTLPHTNSLETLRLTFYDDECQENSGDDDHVDSDDSASDFSSEDGDESDGDEVTATNASTTLQDVFDPNFLNWLEYAICHPNIEQSSWRNLRLTIPDAKRIDNLSTSMIATCESKLRQVNVPSGTMIYANPEANSSALFLTGDETTFDVCHWVTGKHSSWTCVVLPGWGCGWVRNEDSTETESLRMAKPKLRALHWKVRAACSGDRERRYAALMFFLLSYGPKLQLLVVDESSRMEDGQIHDVLNATPVLQSLRVRQKGEFWTGEDLDPSFRNRQPTLREIALVNGSELPSEEAMTGPLANLTSLVVNTRDYSSATALMQRYPHLQYLYIPSSSHTCDDYQAVRQKSRSAVGLDHKKYARAQIPFLHECQLTFMAVVRRLNLGGLDEGVLRHIFSFASSEAERDVWIDSEGRSIYPSRRFWWWRRAHRNTISS